MQNRETRRNTIFPKDDSEKKNHNNNQLIDKKTVLFFIIVLSFTFLVVGLVHAQKKASIYHRAISDANRAKYHSQKSLEAYAVLKDSSPLVYQKEWGQYIEESEKTFSKGKAILKKKKPTLEDLKRAENYFSSLTDFGRPYNPLKILLFLPSNVDSIIYSGNKITVQNRQVEFCLPPFCKNLDVEIKGISYKLNWFKTSIIPSIKDQYDVVAIPDKVPGIYSGDISAIRSFLKKIQEQYSSALDNELPLEIVTRRTRIPLRFIPSKKGNFYLGKTEVTRQQWIGVMGTDPSWFKNSPLTVPVHNISHEEAIEFCSKLCYLEGVPSGTYRLPKEEEWDDAFCGYQMESYTREKVDYYMGIKAHTKVNFRYSEFGWTLSNSVVDYFVPDDSPFVGDEREKYSGRGVKSVGQFIPNAFGLFDMVGNVEEWLQSEKRGSFPSIGSNYLDGYSNAYAYKTVNGREEDDLRDVYKGERSPMRGLRVVRVIHKACSHQSFPFSPKEKDILSFSPSTKYPLVSILELENLISKQGKSISKDLSSTDGLNRKSDAIDKIGGKLVGLSDKEVQAFANDEVFQAAKNLAIATALSDAVPLVFEHKKNRAWNSFNKKLSVDKTDK